MIVLTFMNLVDDLVDKEYRDYPDFNRDLNKIMDSRVVRWFAYVVQWLAVIMLLLTIFVFIPMFFLGG